MKGLSPDEKTQIYKILSENSSVTHQNIKYQKYINRILRAIVFKKYTNELNNTGMEKNITNLISNITKAKIKVLGNITNNMSPAEKRRRRQLEDRLRRLITMLLSNNNKTNAKRFERIKGYAQKAIQEINNPSTRPTLVEPTNNSSHPNRLNAQTPTTRARERSQRLRNTSTKVSYTIKELNNRSSEGRAIQNAPNLQLGRRSYKPRTIFQRGPFKNTSFQLITSAGAEELFRTNEQKRLNAFFNTETILGIRQVMQRFKDRELRFAPEFDIRALIERRKKIQSIKMSNTNINSYNKFNNSTKTLVKKALKVKVNPAFRRFYHLS